VVEVVVAGNYLREIVTSLCDMKSRLNRSSLSTKVMA